MWQFSQQKKMNKTPKKRVTNYITLKTNDINGSTYCQNSLNDHSFIYTFNYSVGGNDVR